jgi:hypothetical protein
MFKRSIRILLVLWAVLAFSALAGASCALASSPWWHLTSVSYPSYLQPGQARDEVQRVTVNATGGEFAVEEPVALEREGAFNTKGEANFVDFSFNAEASVVREGLQRLFHGARTVEVSGGPGGAGGLSPYTITFPGQSVTVPGFQPQPLGVSGGLPVSVGGTALKGEVSAKMLALGRPDGTVLLSAVNLGDANANPQTQPVTVTDELPAGLEAVAIEGAVNESLSYFGTALIPLECSLGSMSCMFTSKSGVSEYPLSVPPYQPIYVRVAVRLKEGAQAAKSGEVNQASVTGGGAPVATAKQSLVVSGQPIPFGVSSYEMGPEEDGGAMDTQAGSHPFQLTTTLMLNETFDGRSAGGAAKDLHFKLPPGLIGNPTPFARCTLKDFLHRPQPLCPAQTVVGVARVTIGLQYSGTYNVIPFTQPLYNLEPAAGEPARFGFVVKQEVPVLLTTAVRTGGDYGVTVNVINIIHEVEFLSSEVTFWGIPGDPRHDNQRGNACLIGAYRAAFGGPDEGYEGETCPGLGEFNPPPLLALPTSCSGPLQTSMEADSWQEPHNGVSLSSTEPLPALDGCNRLPFSPSIRVTPDGTAGSTPTGLNVDVHVDQNSILSGKGLAESNVRGITVALPEGVAINPAGGDGLEACSEGLVGYEGFKESHEEPGVSNASFSSKLPEPLRPGLNFCANASKIGTVTIRTPLLPNAIVGDVYLAAQEANPFGSLVAMYIVAKDPISGTLVKLPGVVHLTSTGQIVSTFENTPQLPFEDAELHFFGGERAPLASPARCGAYTTSAAYTPWSGGEPVHSSSTFEVKTGPNGGPCPGASLPFHPSLTGGTTSNQAGGFSPFTMTMSREDGDQRLQAIQLKMPAGLSGLLSGVELCPEPQADQGTCGPNSLIGETTVGVGVGGDPFSVKGGRVYITGPYQGAPFGLSIVNPAKAGPFDLENTKTSHPACDCVLVRARIEVDPRTADLTITSDNTGPYKIPTIIEGIPLQIKHVNVTVNRPGFTFNPTNCNPMRITGSLDSAEGAIQALSVPFQATNCAVLGFKPGFKVSTAGKTSRANGASLSVKLTYPKAAFGSQANIASVKVDLPKQLPSRLTTLQKACPAAQFEANPAGCPPASIVGHASAITPLVPVPLSGPAYFVSYGGAKFPELVIVLQGYGVTIDLHGETFINKAGITSSTFRTIPDAPVGSFELTLPQGKYSALAANGNLCKGKLAMPTAFVAQNGMTIHQSTPIGVTGCGKAKKASARRKTGKQKKR